ncbi:MAG: DUF3060 domain-containing protein [Mycobacterium sp.]
MSSDGDPERRIAELERPLSAGTPIEALSPSEPRGTSMRVGWIVLALLILGLIVGGIAIVSDRRPAGGGPVARPSATAAPTSSPTSTATVSRPAPVRTLSVAGVGNQRTLACNDSVVSISGVDNTVVLTGRCDRVDVSGVQNSVTIDDAGAIGVSGLNNRVVFHYGTPELSQSGFDNTLQRG